MSFLQRGSCCEAYVEKTSAVRLQLAPGFNSHHSMASGTEFRGLEVKKKGLCETLKDHFYI